MEATNIGVFFENLSGYISPDIIYEMLCSKFPSFLSFLEETIPPSV